MSTKMMKQVTMKNSAKEIGKYLSQHVAEIQEKDENLFERIVYTNKAIEKGEKVLKRDLFDLAKEVMELLSVKAAAEEVKPKAENALKKSGATKSKKTEEEPVDDEETTEEEEKKTSKKGAKATKKKGKSKEEKLAEDAVLHRAEYVAEFPEEYERDGVKYEKASDLTTLKQVYKAIEKGEEFVLAYVWTKRQLLQFPYFQGICDQPKSFEDDLDLAALMYVSDEMRVAYAISTTTDGLYVILPEEFKTYYPTASRFSEGMEFELYRVVEKSEEDEEEEE